MGIYNFKQVSSDDKELDKVQTNIEEVFDKLSLLEILNGKFIENVSVSTTAALVPHRLRRAVKGYFLVKSDAGVILYDQESTNVNKTLFLKLIASGSATVSIWVF